LVSEQSVLSPKQLWKLSTTQWGHDDISKPINLGSLIYTELYTFTLQKGECWKVFAGMWSLLPCLHWQKIKVHLCGLKNALVRTQLIVRFLIQVLELLLSLPK
jgi:hypothetical protein